MLSSQQSRLKFKLIIMIYTANYNQIIIGSFANSVASGVQGGGWRLG